MNGLLEDGLGLMILGMGFVFLFLIVLIFATTYMSRLLNHFFTDEVESNGSTLQCSSVGGVQSTSPVVEESLSIAIAAAVHQHRNQKHVN